MKLMRFPSTLLSVPVRSAANGHGHCTSCSRRRNQASISFSKSKPHHISWISVEHWQIWSVVFHTVPAADSIQWFSFKWFYFYYFCWYLVYSLESNFHVCWSPVVAPQHTASTPRQFQFQGLADKITLSAAIRACNRCPALRMTGPVCAKAMLGCLSSSTAYPTWVY